MLKSLGSRLDRIVRVVGNGRRGVKQKNVLHFIVPKMWREECDHEFQSFNLNVIIGFLYVE